MEDQELLRKLADSPRLRTRLEEILKIIDNADGSTTLADDAEMRIIEEMRDMGGETMRSWAEHQNKRSTTNLKKQKPELRKHRKKKSAGTRFTEKSQ